MRTVSLLSVACIALSACGEKDPGPVQDDCSSPTGGVDVQLLTRAHSQFFGTQPSPVTWVAAQDGTCGWKRLDGPQGEYHFSDSDTESRRVYVTATPGYLGTESTLQLPELTSVPGWEAHWSWDRGGANWTVTTVGGNRGFAGEQKAQGAMRDDRPLADLDGLTRWTYSEQITATGT